MIGIGGFLILILISKLAFELSAISLLKFIPGAEDKLMRAIVFLEQEQASIIKKKRARMLKKY